MTLFSQNFLLKPFECLSVCLKYRQKWSWLLHIRCTFKCSRNHKTANNCQSVGNAQVVDTNLKRSSFCSNCNDTQEDILSLYGPSRLTCNTVNLSKDSLFKNQLNRNLPIPICSLNENCWFEAVQVKFVKNGDPQLK